jgi:hypothetical protein
MKSFNAIAMGLALMGLVTAPAARADETLSPGINAAYTYLTAIPITGSYVQVAQVELVKGKKNRILEADVQLTDTLEIADALAVYVSVNGVHMMPGQNNIPVMTTCNSAYENCTISSNFWADLDELELANPGMFKNQPLVFAIYGIDGGGATANNSLSVRVRMVKK